MTPYTGTGCDDGDLCTYDEACNSSGVCTGGTSITCTSDQCNTRACDGDSTCSVTVLTGNYLRRRRFVYNQNDMQFLGDLRRGAPLRPSAAI